MKTCFRQSAAAPAAASGNEPVLEIRGLRIGLPKGGDRADAVADVSFSVAPGEIAHATFRADRPGGDFAWLVDGAPSGRFAVSGSHLEEGRR